MAPSAPARKVKHRLTWPGWLWLIAAASLLSLGLLKNINLLALLGYFLLVVAALISAACTIVGAGSVASGQTGGVGYSVGFFESPNGPGFKCAFFSIELATGEASQISDP